MTGAELGRVTIPERSVEAGLFKLRPERKKCRNRDNKHVYESDVKV